MRVNRRLKVLRLRKTWVVHRHTERVNEDKRVVDMTNDIEKCTVTVVFVLSERKTREFDYEKKIRVVLKEEIEDCGLEMT